MRWRLILEEYNPELRYIKGEHNIVADALSRLEMLHESEQQKEQLSNQEIAELFAGEIGEDFPKDYPLSYREIESRQKEDPEIRKLLRDKSDVYKETVYPCGDKSYTLITKENRIVLPKVMQKKAVEWYHQVLMHPGETRTELTMAQHFCWKGMRNTVTSVCKRCASCQLHKPDQRRLGHLPAKTVEETPWDTLCIDLVGPYTVGQVKKGRGKTKDDSSNVTTLWAMTMIDPATGWFEIVEIPNKHADYIANVLECTWLTRCPWPTEIRMDKGREFAGEVTAALKNNFGFEHKIITTRNPQSNGIIEGIHQVVADMIRTRDIRSKHDLDPAFGFQGVLAAVRDAVRCVVHTTTQATPTQLDSAGMLC